MATKKTADAATDDESVNSDTPTPEQAREMFKENPGLSAVLTTDGFLHRDGTLTEQ